MFEACEHSDFVNLVLTPLEAGYVFVASSFAFKNGDSCLNGVCPIRLLLENSSCLSMLSLASCNSSRSHNNRSSTTRKIYLLASNSIFSFGICNYGELHCDSMLELNILAPHISLHLCDHGCPHHFVPSYYEPFYKNCIMLTSVDASCPTSQEGAELGWYPSIMGNPHIGCKLVSIIAV